MPDRINLDELLTTTRPGTVSVRPRYNRRDGTGLFGLDVDFPDAWYKEFLMPIINECLNAESITLLGQEWHMNGMSLSVSPDMVRLNRCITIDFRKEKNRSGGAVANLRCLPGARYDFHKEAEAENA